uniref:Uncharacterized protein n=1 Tax=Romanomermis culicivorax TaxID=13658 RepID=A0A915IZB2_ROMCU
MKESLNERKKKGKSKKEEGKERVTKLKKKRINERKKKETNKGIRDYIIEKTHEWKKETNE